MKRFKAGEIALLVVPVAAMAGFAWLQRTRKPPSPEDYQPRVVSIERATPSPLDVSRGYDTIVKITVASAKLKPRGAREKPLEPLDIALQNSKFAYRDKGKTRTLGTTASYEDAPSPTGTVFTCKFPMREYERDYPGEITFRAKIVQTFEPQPLPNGAGFTPHLQSKPVPVSVVIKRAGEKVRAPVVEDKTASFEVESIASEMQPVFNGTSYAPALITTLRYRVTRGEKEQPRFDWVRGEVVNRRGRLSLSATEFRPTGNLLIHLTSSRAHVQIPLTSIPKNAGRVTFEGLLSINDCWPVPISVVVRDENGRLPATE